LSLMRKKIGGKGKNNKKKRGSLCHQREGAGDAPECQGVVPKKPGCEGGGLEGEGFGVLEPGGDGNGKPTKKLPGVWGEKHPQKTVSSGKGKKDKTGKRADSLHQGGGLLDQVWGWGVG